MKLALVRIVFALFALCIVAPAAYAQASRTWVSGVGDDANPCSRTAPCKTFAGAISKTAPGGEIDALDPAGYGALTITKAITIDGGGGQVASVLVSGTNGIVVQAGSNDVVILRNLRFNGISSGINGIRFLAGKRLLVENCDIFGFTTNGLDVALNQTTGATVTVQNTTFMNNGQVGVRITNASTGNVLASLNNIHVQGGTIGVEAVETAFITISQSDIAFFSDSGLKVSSSVRASAINAESNTIHGGGTGANVTGAASGVVIRLSNDDFFTHTGAPTAGAIQSAGNNRRGGNAGTFGAASIIATF
jgi:hypothetical protein